MNHLSPIWKLSASVKLEVQHIRPILRPFRYASRTEDGAGSDVGSHSAIQKTKKGDRRLPRITYFCIVIMYKHLTREQRYAIYLGRQKGETLEIIARSIGVNRSTVSRELKRNSAANGKYVWCKTHEQSESRRKRTPGNRGLAGTLVWRIKELIRNEQWSPRQISGRLAKEGISVSHETIYSIIRKDSTGELAAQCRHKMKYRRSPSRRHETKATNIRNRVSIHDRPEEADGKRFGDWEMDLIVDKDSNAFLTLVERSTNFLLMEKLKHGKKARPLAKTVWRLLLPYKGNALKTITTDNGSEFAEHEWITKTLDMPVYFADSYCSWQKGAVEYENKLVRQYIPKGTDIGTITNGKIKKIRMKINARPREKLNFNTPTEVFLIQPLIDKYKGKERMFNFYERFSSMADLNRAINIGLKEIGKEIGVENLQFYSARHSMATIAINKVGISKWLVNEMLCHTESSMRVTDLYIKKDFTPINEANFKLIDYMFCEQY